MSKFNENLPTDKGVDHKKLKGADKMICELSQTGECDEWKREPHCCDHHSEHYHTSACFEGNCMYVGKKVKCVKVEEE